MKRALGVLAFLPALLLGASLRAEPLRTAETAPAGAPMLLAQQDLYMDAMHSIAEGRPEDASDALTRMIAQEPQHAGAWLDLAIIQCELGRAAEAERLFQLIEERFSPPPGIREVIASHRERGCKGRQRPSQLSFAFGRGYDDNVNQGASSPFFSTNIEGVRRDWVLHAEYLPQHDQFTFATAEYLREIGSRGTTGFVQLRARDNDSLSRYDTTSLRAGLEQPWQFGEWGLRGSGSVGWLTLGGKLYQKLGQLQTRVAPPLRLPDHFRFNMLAGVTRAQYVTLTNYDSTTYEASGLLTYQDERSYVQASAGMMADRGAAARPGGNREGWFAGIQAGRRLGENMNGELGWTRQRWQSDSVYSPGIIDIVRRQNTQLWRAALTIPVKAQHSVNIEWRNVRNNENISIFQYNSQSIQVSWQWQNF